MSEKENLFTVMFKYAESVSLESFTDEDLKDEDIVLKETAADRIAAEGYVRAVFGGALTNVGTAYREIKGWFIGIETKKRYINEKCLDTIAWLKDQSYDNPNLELDMNSFKTWMKTSGTFIWRYYYMLNDEIYKEILRAAKNNELTYLEITLDLESRDRLKVTRMLDSARTINDLIVIVERYRSRCESVYEALLKRNRRVRNFPFQVLLAGYNDLNATVKNIVRLAT